MQDLEEGWTAHKAPTGHTYYYHASTKKSTYKKPVKQVTEVESRTNSHSSDNLAEDQETVASVASKDLRNSDVEHNVAPQAVPGSQIHTSPSDLSGASREKDKDRPKHKVEIPTAVPWLQVHTKQGRIFYHNPQTLESHWSAPDEIHVALEQWKNGRYEPESRVRSAPDSSPEYEVEEEEADESAEEEEAGIDPVEEYDEEDIAWQLAAMEEAGEGPMEMDEDDGPEFTVAERMEVFKKMLEDLEIDPYRTWDSELTKIATDPRYLVVDTTHQRKLAFEEFCITKAKQVQQEKAAIVKEDPRAAFFRLVKQASQKVGYFQDFKRQYKKESAYKAFGNSDHEREKAFRAFIDLKKVDLSVRESKFIDLLKSPSLEDITTDVRYHALPESHAQSLITQFGRKSLI